MNDPTAGPDLHAFAELVRTALREAGVVGNIAYDAGSERLLNETLRESLYLRDAWNGWSRVGAEAQEEWLARYVQAFLTGRQVPESWEDARVGILPWVRGRILHACRPLQQTLDGIRIPALPSADLTPHLVLELAWPQESAVATVTKADLETWGVTPEKAFEAALDNLRRETEGPQEWRGSREFPGVWRSPWQDRFDASRILFRSDFGLGFQGPPVAVAPDDGALLLADGADEEALFHLGRAARREVEGRGTFLWLRPLRLEGDEWRHWLPAPSHGAFAPLKLLYDVNAKADYDRHGGLLQRWLDREDGASRVAPVATLQDDAGNPFTAGVWEGDGPTLLPEADAVLIRRGEETLGLAPFARVLEVMGDLVEERPGYPRLFLAAGFPPDWRIEALQAQDG